MATGERQDLRLISTCSRLPLLGGQEGVALKSLKMTAGNMGLTNPFVGTASSDGIWDLPFQLVTTLPDCLLIWIINSHEIASIINKNICYPPPKKKTGGTMVKNPLARAGDAGDTGSIFGSRRPPLEESMAIHSSTFAWKIPFWGSLFYRDPSKISVVHQMSLVGYSPWGHRVGLQLNRADTHTSKHSNLKQFIFFTSTSLII